MDLIKCPRCGEEYSSSYPACPFCEEDGDTPRKLRLNRTHRVADRKKTQSARGGLIVVLLLVLALLSWYMFGDRVIRHEKPPADPDTEQGREKEPDVPAINDDPFFEPSGSENAQDSENTDPPGGEDTPGNTDAPAAEPPDDGPEASEENVDVSNAKLNRSDFTLAHAGEQFRMKVSGTEATPRWSIDNANVASLEPDGTVTALANGTTTLRCKVGTRELTCIVRVNGTGRTAAPAEAPTTAASTDPAPSITTTPDASAPSTPTHVDASALKVKTNYGTLLQKDPGTGYPDCTVRIGGDPIALRVFGADGEQLSAAWRSNDNSIVKAAEDGKLTPVSSGNATVTATVGDATVTCIIRVR